MHLLIGTTSSRPTSEFVTKGRGFDSVVEGVEVGVYRRRRYMSPVWGSDGWGRGFRTNPWIHPTCETSGNGPVFGIHPDPTGDSSSNADPRGP